MRATVHGGADPHYLVAMIMLLALAAATAHPAANSRAALLQSVRIEFRQTDLNHDGVLTRAEVQKRVAHMKVNVADHDLAARQVQMLTDLWFARGDVNHDGKITLKETEATALAVFNRYDTNHDGLISPAERHVGSAAMMAAPAGKAPEGR